MSYDKVLYERRNDVAFITLNRPEKLNALDLEGWKLLKRYLLQAGVDEEVLTVVITGSGRAFCAGDDISILKDLKDAKDVQELFDTVMSVFTVIETLNKPVIARVNGLAYGGGFEIVMASDFAVAIKDAKFAQPECLRGLFPAYAVSRLIYFVGRKKAAEIMMLGEPISAEEAKNLGLINEVAENEDELDKIIENYIEKLRKAAPFSNMLIKKWMNQLLMRPDENEKAIYAFTHLFSTEDTKEGVRSFLEKREPKFRGR